VAEVPSLSADKGRKMNFKNEF